MFKKIYNYIKYDGKPPKEVLEKLKKKNAKVVSPKRWYKGLNKGFSWWNPTNIFDPLLGGDTGERGSSCVRAPSTDRGTLPRGFYSKTPPTPEPVKSAHQLLKEALDEQERRIDNDLEYMDKMYGECEVCHNDILDINSKCTALTCGNHGNAVVSSQATRRISGVI